MILKKKIHFRWFEIHFFRFIVLSLPLSMILNQYVRRCYFVFSIWIWSARSRDFSINQPGWEYIFIIKLIASDWTKSILTTHADLRSARARQVSERWGWNACFHAPWTYSFRSGTNRASVLTCSVPSADLRQTAIIHIHTQCFNGSYCYDYSHPIRRYHQCAKLMFTVHVVKWFSAYWSERVISPQTLSTCDYSIAVLFCTGKGTDPNYQLLCINVMRSRSDLPQTTNDRTGTVRCSYSCIDAYGAGCAIMALPPASFVFILLSKHCDCALSMHKHTHSIQFHDDFKFCPKHCLRITTLLLPRWYSINQFKTTEAKRIDKNQQNAQTQRFASQMKSHHVRFFFVLQNEDVLSNLLAIINNNRNNHLIT